MRGSHHEIPYPLEICDEFQACQKLAGTSFSNPCNSPGDTFIDLSFNLIQLLFTVADRQERHTRRVVK
jgi:hypothetical protein